MPPLAVPAFDGDEELGQRVKAGLRSSAQWIDQCAATNGSFLSLDAATISALCAQELRRRCLLTADDEAWVCDLLLKIRRFHSGWAENGWDGWWNFRDVGINDRWCFHSRLGNITRAAHILGRKEVSTDPQSRQ